MKYATPSIRVKSGCFAARRLLRVAAIGSGLLAVAAPAFACSVGGFPGRNTPSQGYFLAVASSDTLYAGAGRVGYMQGAGHFGPATERPIYGQLMEVEGVAGLPAGSIPADTERILVVPWDYGANCATVQWSSSALWVDESERGIFLGTLRDPADWTDGIPTFDVFRPSLHPYPQAARSQLRGSFDPDTLLEIDALFSLLQRMPDAASLRAAPEAAAAAFLGWVRENPDAAGKFPVDELRNDLARGLAEARRAAIEPLIAGTYRFTVSSPGTSPRVFHARTYSTPAYTLWRSGSAANDEGDLRPIDGYWLLAIGAESIDDLPADCEFGRDVLREAYLGVLLEGDTTLPSGGTSWQGTISPLLLAGVFQGLQDLTTEEERRLRGYRRPPESTLDSLPGRFWLAEDGTLRAEQSYARASRELVLLQGQRVSEEAVTCAAYP